MDGVPLDFYGGETVIDGVNGGKVEKMDTFVNVAITDKNRYEFYLNNGVFEVKNRIKVDEIVDFQSAVNILTEKMSGFNKIEIVEVEPLYVLQPQYDVASNEYYAKPGNTVKAIPVYSFLVKFNGDNSFDDCSVDIKEGNDYCYINVSMLDGSLTSNLEEKGYTPQ